MSSRLYPKTPLLGACTAVWRDDKVLLVLRKRAPNPDNWAMPGGGVEVGESLVEAAIREVHEETGLVITNPVFNRFHEVIRRDSQGKTEVHFVLAIFATQSGEGEAVAADDAAALGWYTLEEVSGLVTTPRTEEFLRESLTLLGRSF